MQFEEYSELTDEELLDNIKQGNQSAIDILILRYKNIVRQKGRALYLIGGDRDDLMQEGMIGLYKAIRDFDEEKESRFSNFADLCITRQMYTAIKASNRKKNIPLNTYISFYTPAFEGNNENDDTMSMVDVLLMGEHLNPEEMLIDKENTSTLEFELKKNLSKYESDVLQLYIKGLTYTEIADYLQKQPKSIDNALQRIKSKLNQILKK